MDQNLLTISLSVIIIISHLIVHSFSGPNITFVDVGQGDGAILSINNFQMIVDGGPGEELVSKIGRHMNNFDRSIELLVVTHWHSDHYFGLHQLMKTYKINEIVLPLDLCKENVGFEMIKKLVRDKGIIIKKSFNSEINGVTIEVYSSSGSECIKNSKDINNSSLVTKIEYKGLNILMMGDIESDFEDKYKYDSDILKAGHHCSDTSSSFEFLKEISPLVTICSYGENFYGHPSKEVIGRFKALGIKEISTYNYGDITVNLKSRLIYNQDNKLLMKL